MRFYHIVDAYIEYLRNYEPKVAENKHEGRPYIGVVVKIGDVKYYVPFSSPKPKHLKMKNGKDFRKICGGRYGVINFNNMIPVPDKVLLPIDIEKEPDERYRRLLQNQYKSIMDESAAIERTATNLRTLVFTSDEQLSGWDYAVKARCCNLVLLEQVYTQF